LLTVFECGTIVNPVSLKNQVEGAVNQGLGGALFEAIEFAEGKILNPCFPQHRLLRSSDVPQLETLLLDRKDLARLPPAKTPSSLSPPRRLMPSSTRRGSGRDRCRWGRMDYGCRVGVHRHWKGNWPAWTQTTQPRS